MNKKTFLSLSLLFALLFSFACNDDDKGKLVKHSIALDQNTLELSVGIRGRLTADLLEDDKVIEADDCIWMVDNDNIEILGDKKGMSVSFVGKKEGEAIISIESLKNKISASCTVKVEKRTIKILAIGNSFSEDAIENYLWNIAKAEGINIKIGNLFIGGCDLATHRANATNNIAAYDYREIENGTRTSTANTSILDVLNDEQWDYVSLQQVSQLSGKYETYSADLPYLIDYVKEKEPNASVILHQTWAYAQNSTHPGFANYNNDQMTMYNAIVDATNQTSDIEGIDFVIPAGTAIQNGRTSAFGDIFCRDGYHLDLTIGRYTAACTWFECIFGTKATATNYGPSDISSFRKDVAQHAAHYAITKPFEVTELVNHKEIPRNDKVLEYAVFIDFGFATLTSARPWNNVTEGMAKNTIIQLIDEKENETGIQLQLIDLTNGTNGDGPTSTIPEYPDSATRDSWFGNSKGEFSGKSVPQIKFAVNYLNKDIKYKFTFYASRMNAGDNRDTKFTIDAANQNVLYLNASNNRNTTVSGEIIPDQEGTATVTVTSGPNNTSSYGFFHIGILTIEPVK